MFHITPYHTLKLLAVTTGDTTFSNFVVGKTNREEYLKQRDPKQIIAAIAAGCAWLLYDNNKENKIAGCAACYPPTDDTDKQWEFGTLFIEDEYRGYNWTRFFLYNAIRHVTDNFNHDDCDMFVITAKTRVEEVLLTSQMQCMYSEQDPSQLMKKKFFVTQETVKLAQQFFLNFQAGVIFLEHYSASEQQVLVYYN